MATSKKKPKVYSAPSISFLPSIMSDVSSIPAGAQIESFIPPYEDSGVRFQGYFKVPVTENNFVLKRQNTKFISILAQSVSGHNNLERVNYATKDFFITYIVFSATKSGVTPSYFVIYDASDPNTNGSPVFIYPKLQDEESIAVCFDFSSSPRKLSQRWIDFYNTALGDMAFTLYGFEQDK